MGKIAISISPVDQPTRPMDPTLPDGQTDRQMDGQTGFNLHEGWVKWPSQFHLPIDSIYPCPRRRLIIWFQFVRCQGRSELLFLLAKGKKKTKEASHALSEKIRIYT